MHFSAGGKNVKCWRHNILEWAERAATNNEKHILPSN